MAIITGTGAYEKIYGTAEDDIIDGKGGNDLIYDFYGTNDTYIFDYGYYQPTFTDNGGFDTIIFGEGIKASDIKFYITKGGYLMPRIQDTNDKPEVANWNDPKYKIERWVFSDGTVLTSDDIDKLIDYNTRVLVYSTGSDNVTIGQGNNLIYLMQGDDTITTVGGNNIIEASSGNDFIYNHGSGNDEIYMGPGTDYTEDFGGNDRYIYNRGDGQDTILDKAGNDVLKFGRGITKEELRFKLDGNDLVITFANMSSDKLTIKNWNTASNYKIEILELWDKSQITAAEIDKKLASPTPPPSELTPTIVGTDEGEYYGGNYGNDVYYLKKGNDKVMDYAGDDVYIFNKGDGQDTIKDQNGNDTIVFGSGITKDDLIITQSGDNLIINFKNSTDQITITDWFRVVSYGDYKIERFEFADGSYLTDTQILQLGNNKQISYTPTIVGTDEGEYFGGNYGNDVYYLKGGNDKVMDYAGDDVYLFNRGDGRDIIKDERGNDILVFGSDIKYKDVSFSQSGTNLIIDINGSNDSITISDWFKKVSYADYNIEKIEFSDGSYTTSDQINDYFEHMNLFPGDLDYHLTFFDASGAVISG